MPDAGGTIVEARPARLAAVAVLGGLFISVGDHLFHVRTGILVHHWYPQWDGQTLVVLPMFVGAAAAMVFVARPLARTLPRPTPRAAVLAAALFFAAYAFTGWAGTDHPMACLLVLLAAFAVRLALALPAERRPTVIVGILIGLGGCLGEALVSKMGLFDYVHRDAIVPFWLFPLYLNGAAAVLAATKLSEAPAEQ